MTNEGPFVQFTYGPFPPVSGPIVRRLKLGVSQANQVWLNLPPAAIWRYERLGEPDRAGQTAVGAAANSSAVLRTRDCGRACIEYESG